MQLLLRYCSSLLLLCLLAGANRCPDPDTLKPYCECSVGFTLWPIQIFPATSCNKVNQLQVLKGIFSATGDRPLVYLEVKDSLINYFPASALKEKNTRVLVFNGTTLVSLFDEDLVENDKFYALSLTNSNVLRGIQWSQLRNLHNLSYINTKGVTIRHLGKDFVENIPSSLLSIKLFGTHIRRLHDEAFSRLSKVQTIEVESGRLTTLKRSMFPKENVIERLGFRGQEISSLPDGLFNDMPKLKAVSIGDNQITVLAESVFKVLADRNVVVYLHPSPIVCDCSVTWAAHRSNWELHAGCETPDELYGKKITDLGANWGCGASG